MSKIKELTKAEIGDKLSAGRTFYVSTERERKAALDGAKYVPVEITTKSVATGGFKISFLKP